jgi:hypothetical protein
VLPVTVVGMITLGVAYTPRVFMATNFNRIIVTTVLSETTLLLFGWLIALDNEERMFVRSKLKGAMSLVVRKIVPCE